MRSMILPPPSGGDVGDVMSWPSTLRWIVSSTRSRTVSLYFVGSNSSRRRLLDELLRELELRRPSLAVGDRDFGRRANLVGVVQLLHHEHAVERAQEDEVLLPARRVLAERGLARLLQRRGEQAIRPIAALVGSEVVDLLQIFAVDLGQRDELDDVDRARRLLLERLELLGVRTTYWSLANS